jgi:hypothetical protein
MILEAPRLELRFGAFDVLKDVSIAVAPVDDGEEL